MPHLPVLPKSWARWYHSVLTIVAAPEFGDGARADVFLTGEATDSAALMRMPGLQVGEILSFEL